MQSITLEELKHILFYAFRDHLTMKDIENIIINEEESLKENAGNYHTEYEGGELPLLCVCVCVCVCVCMCACVREEGRQLPLWALRSHSTPADSLIWGVGGDRFRSDTDKICMTSLCKNSPSKIYGSEQEWGGGRDYTTFSTIEHRNLRLMPRMPVRGPVLTPYVRGTVVKHLFGRSRADASLPLGNSQKIR